MRSVPVWVAPPSGAIQVTPLDGSATGSASMTRSQLVIRPWRSAWAFEMPPGRLYGLMTIVSLPSPQSTRSTAVPLLT